MLRFDSRRHLGPFLFSNQRPYSIPLKSERPSLIINDYK